MSLQAEIRIPYSELEKLFHNILLKYSFSEAKAAVCAQVFADNSLDGVYTHGVNRFPKFIELVSQNHVIPANEPSNVAGFGAMEQWDGNLGPGPNNAIVCTERAMALADANGIGCVAIANTNHWMRGGTYAWRAAKKGYAFICWTNTIANMPGWGARDSRLGNNPIIMAVPKDDEAVVLDMAISQFSYGAMEKFAMQNKNLPVPGGYNENDEITADPQRVLKTQRSLPIGYWKGAGLSLLLDILAAILPSGKSTYQITAEKVESSVSQVFIAIKLSSLHNASAINAVINSIINDYHSAQPDSTSNVILYPGERVLQTRKDNIEKGIPINEWVWQQILGL